MWHCALDIQQVEQDLIITARGRFTHRVYDTFVAATDRMINERSERLVIDMSGVEFLDSGGIGLLLMGYDIARRHGVTGIIRGADGRVAQVLANAHLNELFQLT